MTKHIVPELEQLLQNLEYLWWLIKLAGSLHGLLGGWPPTEGAFRQFLLQLRPNDPATWKEALGFIPASIPAIGTTELSLITLPLLFTSFSINHRLVVELDDASLNEVMDTDLPEETSWATLELPAPAFALRLQSPVQISESIMSNFIMIGDCKPFLLPNSGLRTAVRAASTASINYQLNLERKKRIEALRWSTLPQDREKLIREVTEFLPAFTGNGPFGSTAILFQSADLNKPLVQFTNAVRGLLCIVAKFALFYQKLRSSSRSESSESAGSGTTTQTEDLGTEIEGGGITRPEDVCAVTNITYITREGGVTSVKRRPPRKGEAEPRNPRGEYQVGFYYRKKPGDLRKTEEIPQDEKKKIEGYTANQGRQSKGLPGGKLKRIRGGKKQQPSPDQGKGEQGTAGDAPPPIPTDE